MPSETRLTVTATEQITPAMVRVRFRSDDLSAFADSAHTDRYVKLVFPVEGAEQPVVRTYTALRPDVDLGTVVIDFVVHGDTGTAGPWAAAAEPGDSLVARGPGGAYAPSAEADWHLIAGDESALPAITAALAALPEDATGHVLVEVEGPEHEIPVDLPGDVTFSWVHRGAPAHAAPDEQSGVNSPLVEAVRGVPWEEGRVQVFVHGEAQTVMHGIRPYLLKERGLDRKDVSISGYWRRGRSEEGFRQWKSELAATEAGNA